MNNRQLEKFCPLTSECNQLLQKLIDRLGLSARAFSRIIKLSRTIADLEAAAESVVTGAPPVPGPILPRHISEASAYRFLDKRNILDL